MASYRELLAQVKAEIDEISSIDAHERLESSDGSIFVDVREADEWDEGHIPGAIYTGRGRLEQRIEGLVPDKTRPLVVYCSMVCVPSPQVISARPWVVLLAQPPVPVESGST